MKKEVGMSAADNLRNQVDTRLKSMVTRLGEKYEKAPAGSAEQLALKAKKHSAIKFVRLMHMHFGNVRNEQLNSKGFKDIIAKQVAAFEIKGNQAWVENDFGEYKLERDQHGNFVEELQPNYKLGEYDSKAFDFERSDGEAFASLANFFLAFLLIPLLFPVYRHYYKQDGRAGWGFFSSRTATSADAHSIVDALEAYRPDESAAQDAPLPTTDQSGINECGFGKL